MECVKNTGAAVKNKGAAIRREARIHTAAAKAAGMAAARAVKEEQQQANNHSAREASMPSVPRLTSKRSSILNVLGMESSVQKRERNRSLAAQEGIALLKRGSQAIKYTQKGKGRLTTFKLTKDETALKWQGSGAKVWTKITMAREVVMADVVELLVGHESAAFKQHMNRACAGSRRETDAGAAKAHLSLSLVLMSALAQPPSEMDDAAEHGVGAGGSRSRATLDVSFEDEETFGLWVAALRALLDEGRKTCLPLL